MTIIEAIAVAVQALDDQARTNNPGAPFAPSVERDAIGVLLTLKTVLLMSTEP